MAEVLTGRKGRTGRLVSCLLTRELFCLYLALAHSLSSTAQPAGLADSAAAVVVVTAVVVVRSALLSAILRSGSEDLSTGRVLQHATHLTNSSIAYYLLDPAAAVAAAVVVVVSVVDVVVPVVV